MEPVRPPTTLRTLTEEERQRVVSEGQRIFRDVVPEEEKRKHQGGYVAIDTVDRRYSFGASLEEADEGLSPLPEGHLVYIQRIGLPFRIQRSPRL